MSQQTPAERTPKIKETNEQKALPVLPVRDTVLFPHAVLPLDRRAGKLGSVDQFPRGRQDDHRGGAARSASGRSAAQRSVYGRNFRSCP